VKRFRDYSPEQPYLLPVSPREWLPDGHLAYFVHEVVGRLDLSRVFDSYREERGRPPFDPRMMVAVWIYAYSVGVRSSRRVERALVEDIAFRFLSGNQQAKYWAINQFRTRHREALSEVFVQSVRLAERAGLVSLEHVAIDGSKVKAAASKHKAMSYARMQEEEQRLLREIEQYFDECDRVDAAEDEEFGDDSGNELPEHLRTRAGRLEAIQRAMRELEEEAREEAAKEQSERREKAEAEGREFHPRSKPVEARPRPGAQRNFNDPESRIMLKGKDFLQAFNGQLGVDSSHQVIVAAELSNQAADAPQLPSLYQQIHENTGRYPDEVSADAGYWSKQNLRVIEASGAEAFIAPGKVKHDQWRAQKAPRGPIPKNLSEEQLMRRKLATKRGRQRYTKRQGTVEPVFGQFKSARGLLQFLHRGLDKNRCMWRLEAAVHNLLKIFRAGGFSSSKIPALST
jgi:transposase